jgi:hypothetical protein
MVDDNPIVYTSEITKYKEACLFINPVEPDLKLHIIGDQEFYHCDQITKVLSLVRTELTNEQGLRYREYTVSDFYRKKGADINAKKQFNPDDEILMLKPDMTEALVSVILKKNDMDQAEEELINQLILNEPYTKYILTYDKTNEDFVEDILKVCDAFDELNSKTEYENSDFIFDYMMVEDFLYMKITSVGDIL